MKKKVFYYEDELNDDFAQTVKKGNPLPQNYRYISKNPFFKLFSFFIYRIVVFPLVWIYIKIKFHHKFVGAKKMRRHKGGSFLYCNHVTIVGDAFIPNLISVRKRNYIVTGAETNSLTSILWLLKSLGNIPIGQTNAQRMAMVKCVQQRVKEGASVTIYPEAHIWPYYTGIRPFGDASFYYAVKLNVPVFCKTTCFQKKRFGKSPRIISVIDGPFYPKEELTRAQNMRYLRDEVYATMCRRAAEYSTYSVHEYHKKESKDGE